MKKWNWQQKGWPRFSYHPKKLISFENKFLSQSGVTLGSIRHFSDKDHHDLIIEIISDEALKTSEIEGEYLDRESIQSSLRGCFGLTSKQQKTSDAEDGISQMMVDLYKNFAKKLTHKNLFDWHRQLMRGHSRVQRIGRYRTHPEAMQIVSGSYQKPKVHFEAPPSQQIKKEMDAFITWFNQTSPSGSQPLPPLTRAGLSHLYFVCIHPFEDGNGRLSRALCEKVLAQSLDRPTLISLSQTIALKRKNYYTALETNNKTLHIDSWLNYFAQTILDAIELTEKRISFIIAKTKFYDRLKDQLNKRQAKIVARIFKEGINGFKGGLSANNYIAITKTSRATATRDLNDLVTKGALTKTGKLKHARYELNL